MIDINNYISEKLYIGKDYKRKSDANPINVIRNTFIDHAKGWWGDACGFEKDEIHIKPTDDNMVISVWTDRHLSLADLKQVGGEICGYLWYLDCEYDYKVSIESGKNKLVFVKK